MIVECVISIEGRSLTGHKPQARRRGLRSFALPPRGISENDIGFIEKLIGSCACTPGGMHNPQSQEIGVLETGVEDVAREFLHGLDTAMSERRLLEEIGKPSCDELATVLVMWNRDRVAETPRTN